MAKFLIFFLLLLLLPFITNATHHPPPRSLPPSHPETPPRDEANTLTPSAFLAPILLDLGFQELAMAIHSLPPSWSGPSTVFAPSDASFRACPDCSSPATLLQQHTVPGLFSIRYLRSLPSRSKIETLDPGRCLTITSSRNGTDDVLADGVKISQPDLFANGFLVIHGLDPAASRLTPLPCHAEGSVELSDKKQQHPISVMRLLLRDVTLRLRVGGYSVLALALHARLAELVGLRNLTIFALPDEAIFDGGHAYVREIGFHIVPNRTLTAADLTLMRPSEALPTMDSGEAVAVTGAAPLRVNFVRVGRPDMVRNSRIMIHGVTMPLRHLSKVAEGFGTEAGPVAKTGLQAAGEPVREESCGSAETDGGCGVELRRMGKRTAEMIEDHHGL